MNLPQMLGWSSPADIATHYAVLLSPIDFAKYSAARPLKLLDLGCGFGLLLDWLAANGHLDAVDYTGVDLVDPILDGAQRRWPKHRFEHRDVRDEPYARDSFDYCVIAGVFTVKNSNSYEDKLALVQETLKAIWPSVVLGLAFNSMSKHTIEWPGDGELFRWPLDDLMAFCIRELSRHVSIKMDYGFWDVSIVVRKEPAQHPSKTSSAWGPLQPFERQAFWTP
jgi:SAM-dependent methyltransferase